MATSWDPRQYLLLAFKDDLKKASEQGFSLVAESYSIWQHMEMVRKASDEKPSVAVSSAKLAIEQMPLFSEPEFGPVAGEEVDVGCCVWGWWRKPWETHPLLLQQLADACHTSENPKVLLYTQYQSRLYEATLHAVYYKPFLTTVAIPSNWESCCPEDYRKLPRLCGAFFALRIVSEPFDARKYGLHNFLVDASSFELNPYGIASVIPAPDGLEEICTNMVDRQFTRALLRSSEHTALVLREFKQAEYTRKILAKLDEINEPDFLHAAQETAWDDLRELLTNAPYATWSQLCRFPLVLKEFAQKARQTDQRTTRFDWELVAWACSAPEMSDLMLRRDREVRFSDLGGALVKWVTAPSAIDGRQAAAKVYSEAWKVASSRYGFSPLEGYWEQLPAVEAIVNAVKYELGGKFYRDHLSHNIRAGLLGARLTSVAFNGTGTDINNSVVAFYGGLCHDIAMPVAGFPDLVRGLAIALSRVGLSQDRLPAQPLIDKTQLMQGINNIANLIATPDLLNAYNKNAYAGWEDTQEAIKFADKSLLADLLKCATTQDHAIMGAAMIFYQSVLGRCGGNLQQYEQGLKTVLQEMTGTGAKSNGRELLALLQCIALHDRRAGTRHYGVVTAPSPVPAPLPWEDYALPMLVHIADELQEWGRPMAALEGMWAIDAAVELALPNVSLQLTATSDRSTFTSVAFSLLESLMGKVRGLSDIQYDKGTIKLDVGISDLSCFAAQYVSSRFELRLAAQIAHHEARNWPYQTTGSDGIRSRAQEHLVALSPHNGGGAAYDYLMVTGRADQLDSFVRLVTSNAKVSSISLNGKQLSLCFMDGTTFESELEEYWHGVINRSQSVPLNKFPADGCSIARVSLTGMSMPSGKGSLPRGEGPHLVPRPHILDFDWRFTVRSARWIIGTARYYAQGKQICYLGCPTLALWHQLLWPRETNWLLFDRGHHALNEWLKASISPERYIQYDVFSALRPDQHRRFNIVVTDPPWHREEYSAFCRRAAQLVEDSGYICVSSYPSVSSSSSSQAYKPGKYEDFTRISRREFGKSSWLGSFEIDYEVPDFERSWGGHKKFEHEDVYRPAKMDMYHVVNVARDRNGLSAIPNRLPSVEPLANGHYLRYSEATKFPCHVKINRRKSVQRVRKWPDELIAWSTANALIERSDDGVPVATVEELAKAVSYWEETQNNTSPPS